MTQAFLGILLVASAICAAQGAWVLVRGIAYRPRRALRLVVVARIDHAAGLFSLRLRRPWPSRLLPLPRHRSGQYLSVGCDGTRGTRRYSLARWTSLPFAYEVCIRREARGRLSQALYERALPGRELSVARPAGDFVLPRRAVARRAVMIAGGVGITPLLAMAEEWASRRSPYAAVHVYWQARTEDEWTHRDLLERLALRAPGLHVRFLASRPAHGRGTRICVDDIAAELGGLADTEFFLCAGSTLLDAMRSQLRRAGVAESAIHFERFAVASADTGQWRLSHRGRALRFDNHPTLLDALEDAGVDIAADCRTGTCGQCRLTLVAGRVHQLLEPAVALASSQVLACCAVPLSDLETA